MRSTYLAWRLLSAACLLSGVSHCAQGGIDDDELNSVGGDDGDDDVAKVDGGTRDAGKDARASSSDDDDDDDSASTTKRDGGGGSTTPRDSGTGTSGNKDAGGGSGGGGGGGGGLGAAIKCPSPMVCDSTLSGVLSIFDMSIKSGTPLCASSGGILPMGISCTSVDACKSARLTTATCVAGSCVQPCTQ